MTAAALLILGSAFMLLAGVGLIRLPDLFLRMSATAKAATLGAALTAPVAAHKIGRAGYRRGAPLYEGTICDEAKGQLDRDEEEGGSVP